MESILTLDREKSRQFFQNLLREEDLERGWLPDGLRKDPGRTLEEPNRNRPRERVELSLNLMSCHHIVNKPLRIPVAAFNDQKEVVCRRVWMA